MVAHLVVYQLQNYSNVLEIKEYLTDLAMSHDSSCVRK